MSATLADLTTPQTYDDERTALLAGLTSRNFPATAWQPGSVARTLVEIDAQALADLSSTVALVAAGGLLSTATGDWLSLLASEVYALTRNAAIATAGTVTLTDAASAGPFSISPGQLFFASASGLRYRSTNTATLTLPLGGTLSLSVAAESAGAAYNVANGTITTLLTPLPGVTCNNPDPGTGTWITTQGADAETDVALRSRCSARWPESGFGSPAASYDLWARTAATGITRTNVVADAAGPNGGGIAIYVAGSSGPAASGDVTAAQTYIQARAPLCAVPTVTNTTAVAVTVTATLYGKSQYQSTATASANTALQNLVATTPVGGKLYLSAIIEALMLPMGVENVVVTAPAADTTLTASQVATLTASLSWSNT